jgi:hypothetical protein
VNSNVRQALAMVKEEISFRCPLCRKKFSARNVKNHVKRWHPNIDKPRFILLLREAEESGKRVVERKPIKSKGVKFSQKTAFSAGALTTAKYVSFVPGGAVGLGKKS